MRLLLVAGDVLEPIAVDAVLGEASSRPERFVNGYGSTENTGLSAVARVEPERPGGPVPIGRPIAGSTCYVIDAEGRLGLPTHAAGHVSRAPRGAASLKDILPATRGVGGVVTPIGGDMAPFIIIKRTFTPLQVLSLRETIQVDNQVGLREKETAGTG